jgi:hypothetical protein
MVALADGLLVPAQTVRNAEPYKMYVLPYSYALVAWRYLLARSYATARVWLSTKASGDDR